MANNVLVEAFYDGDWQDITSRVYTRDEIKISRGSADEDQAAPPCTCTLTLNNRDGWANPRNPDSALYGKAGRNTPLRVWCGPDPVLDDTFTRSVTNQWTGGSFTWALSGGTVPGDYDVNGSKGTQTSTTTGTFHYATTDTGQTDGRFRTTFDLSAATLTGGSASVWVLGRFTDTSNYYAAVVTPTTAGTTTFAVFKRVAGVLTLVSDAGVTHAGYGGLFDTTSFKVEFYVERDRLFAKMWDSTNFDEPSAWNITATDTDLTTGTLAGVASRREAGNTNANLAARFDRFTATPGPCRFAGEISSWRPRRAIRGDAWTEITASGITRRLGQGTDPILPALSKAIELANPLAHWPLDDLVDAQQARSGLNAGFPMVAQRALVDFQDLAPPGASGSAAPSLVSGNALVGKITGGSGANGWSFAFAFRGLAGPQTGLTPPYVEPLFIWEPTGSVVWALQIIGETNPASQTLWVVRTPFASGHNDPFISQVGNNLFDDQWHLIQVTAWQTGGTVSGELYVDGELVGTDSDAVPPTDLGAPIRAESLGIETATFSAALDMDHFNIAQIAVFDTPFAPDLYQAMLGHAGELTAARFLRLCTEHDITAYVVGDEADTRAMGAQYSDTLINHLREIESTEQGILVEPRHDRALALVTGHRLYNQDSVLDLDFAADQVAPPLEPDIDDLNTRNDVTVTRREGSTFRMVQATGPLNVNDPTADPDGVGRVTTQVTVNPQLDTGLPNYAGWLLHLGTIDEERYPQISVELAADGAASIADAACRVDIGDRITVDNIPDRPDIASLLVLGYTETIGTHTRLLTFNCMPESAFRVGVYGTARYGTAGSTVTTTTTATSWSLATTSGPLWTTRAGAFPFDVIVGGERVTVTTITGAASPQTATVVRSVNGVVKAHTGAPVRLFEQARYAL